MTLTSDTPHTPAPRRVPLTPQTRVLRSGERLLVRRGDAVSVIEGPAGALVEQLLAAASASDDPGLLPLPVATTTEEELVLDQLEALLREATLITEADPVTFDDADETLRTLWMRTGGDVGLDELAATRAAARVVLTGSGALAGRIAAGLREGGLDVRHQPDAGAESLGSLDLGGVDFVVAVADHQDDAGLRELNRRALASGTPWLPVVADDGLRTVVGPLVHPGSSACWECVRLRRAANFPDRDLSADLGAASATAGPSTAAGSVGSDLVVTGVAVEKVIDRVVLGELAAMSRPGAMAVVRPAAPGLAIDEHLVLRVPRCPECSPAAGRGEPQVWFHGGAR